MSSKNGGDNWQSNMPLRVNLFDTEIDVSYKLRIVRPVFLNSDGTLDIPKRGLHSTIIRHICTMSAYAYAHMRYERCKNQIEEFKEIYKPNSAYTDKAKIYCAEQGIPYVPRNDVPPAMPSPSRMPRTKKSPYKY